MANEKLTNRQAIGVLDGLWSNPLFSEHHRQAFEIGIKAIKALEQEPKTEAVKTAIMQELKDHFIEPEDAGLTIKGEYWLAREVLAIIEETESKTGHWIDVTNGRGGHECDLCHEYAPSYQGGDEWLTKYCPNCGAKMVEPQERSK